MFTSSLLDIPRPFVDPIMSLVEVLGIVSLSIRRPLSSSMVALFLNSDRCAVGLSQVATSDTAPAHHLVASASRVPSVHSVVLVSSRPHCLVRSSDVAHLQSFTRAAHNAGFALCDWVVVGRGGMYCPRTLTDLPNPWPTPLSF